MRFQKENRKKIVQGISVEGERKMDYKPEELLPLVKELSGKYTGKASTSITYEAAQQLMEAVLYCIREDEMEIREGDICPEGKLPAREVYERGYERVLRKVQRARAWYNQIAKQFDSYGNREYEETFRKGIPGFFLWYDAKLNPQNHIITLDYPVFGRDEKACGIDLVWEYLWGIRQEQKFLAKFPREYVSGVNRERYPEYEEYFVNVCHTPLRRVLCCMMADVDLSKTELSQEEYLRITNAVNRTASSVQNASSSLDASSGLDVSVDQDGAAGPGLKGRLEAMLKLLVKEVYQGDEELYRYLSQDLENLAFELKNGVENHCLKEVVG